MQDECMPLRRVLHEFSLRRTQAFNEHRSTFRGFFGMSPNQGAQAELNYLDAQQSEIVQRICAIAGEETFVKEKWGYSNSRRRRTPWELADIARPLDTPHTREIDEIKNQIKDLASSKPTYGEDAAYWRHQMEQQLKQERKQQREATAAQRAAAKAEREAATAEREEAKKRKAEADRAAVASATGKAREHADNVKRSLRKDHDCPYCGSGLGDQPHADHIYPLSKGGRSVSVNMVYVCAVCNNRKGDMTLATFVATYRLDRDTIETRLQRLGKEY